MGRVLLLLLALPTLVVAQSSGSVTVESTETTTTSPSNTPPTPSNESRPSGNGSDSSGTIEVEPIGGGSEPTPQSPAADQANNDGATTDGTAPNNGPDSSSSEPTIENQLENAASQSSQTKASEGKQAQSVADTKVEPTKAQQQAAFTRGRQGVLVGKRITAIDVYGANKTTRATIIALAKVSHGDTFNFEFTQQAIKNLLLSGLFKSADVFGGPDKRKDGVRLVIKVRDKHSWVIAPTYYNQPTNRGGGIGYGENNLLGSNKKLLIYGQIATGDSFLIGAFVDPNIKQSRWRWQLDVYLRDSRIFEYEAPKKLLTDPMKVRRSKLRYLNLGGEFGGTFGALSINGRLRGAKVEFREAALEEGATTADVFSPDQPGAAIPAPEKNGWDMSTTISAQVSYLEDWFGVRNGGRFTAKFEKSLPALGSDYDYWKLNLDLLLAKNLFLKDHNVFGKHNIVVKGKVGYGQGLPFHNEFTAGGTSQRGYENNQFRGNMIVAGTAQYSFQLFEIAGFGLRPLAFWDTSYTTFTSSSPGRHYLPNHTGGGLSPLKNSVGAGIRVFTKKIVIPLLGIDVGYGLERGDYEIYLAIGLSD